MIKRLVHPNKLVTYQSTLLEDAGLPHLFSTRIGVNQSPMDLGREPLNLAKTTENQPFMQHLASLVSTLKLNRGYYQLRSVRQVHGSQVQLTHQNELDLSDAPLNIDDAPDTGINIPNQRSEHATVYEADKVKLLTDKQFITQRADAIISQHPADLLSIRIADCVPILLATENNGAVAAVHAGWRGIVSGVIPAAVARLVDLRRTPARGILAAVGPCIGLNHFEVGDEVVNEFKYAGLIHCVEHHPSWGKAHINLLKAVVMQLQRSGISKHHIDYDESVCTYRMHQDFHSFRRDGEHSGRMIAMVKKPD